MASQSRLIFVNLPVADLPASKEFFGRLGFEFNPQFTDDSAACMVVSEQAYVMLLERGYFAGFTSKPVADAHQSTQLTVAVSAETREAVDELAETALGAGGTSVKDPMDMGFMYQRSFYDLDGHLWEISWMSQEAIEQGPPDMAESA